MIKVAEPIIGEEEIQATIEALKSGMYTSGKRVEQFEEMFADYIGTKYAVACNSGTAALHLSLLALGVGPGDEVIVPPMTFFATVEAVLMVQAIPVFVDVDDCCQLDFKEIENHITEKTKAIIPVHFYGIPCYVDEIHKIAKRYGIYVIEDCAQAHGAEIDGKKVGSFGDTGCFSFFATKNMTTIEGGIITTNNQDLYEQTKLIRSHGMTDRNTHTVLGYNYRLNELFAAIGIEQLKKLDSFNKKRIENSLYLAKNISEISIQLLPIHKRERTKSVYFWFPISVSNYMRPKFMKYLKDNGIGFRYRYDEPIYKQPIFKRTYKNVYCKNAEFFSPRMLGLPNHPGLTKNELDKIIETVESFW